MESAADGSGEEGSGEAERQTEFRCAEVLGDDEGAGDGGEYATAEPEAGVRRGGIDQAGTDPLAMHVEKVDPDAGGGGEQCPGESGHVADNEEAQAAGIEDEAEDGVGQRQRTGEGGGPAPVDFAGAEESCGFSVGQRGGRGEREGSSERPFGGIRLEIFVDEAAGIGTGFVGEVEGHEVVDNVFGDGHDWIPLRACMSFWRARWTLTRAETGVISRRRATSS